ncbi:MAG: PHP domain-containing protein [Candidatus Parvarchaeota archaeon]|nr:PHP domain-containing protein [Candidatus Jingweiarchaeum tengchongense]MCW1300306.1 PHP domain-containing protein [Candidatus Jingweiarchaeum tengchongense]MCW1304898.1 PHP domain-containing protein [Candidatus Jingweiarchaeum tengchongense]MCW1305802.1 PHP domain-containing protein [Candidatus Jingweiarchaeum tengchongense]MCW1309833.1 PHP domain-containing protein [Candidatus Jingweiarchaeum tengchongense]
MKIDLHCHTIYSKNKLWGRDAFNTPKEMVKAAMKKGLDGLAITDHQTVKGSLVARDYIKRIGKRFLLITGIEICTKDGEVIGLDIKEDVRDDLSLEETIEKIHALGGIAIAVHPFAKHLFRKCVGDKAIKADAVEVFNASCRGDSNPKALELANKFKKPKVAGSDAHHVTDVGNAGIICDGDPISMILKGKVEIFGKYNGIKSLVLLSGKKLARFFGCCTKEERSLKDWK